MQELGSSLDHAWENLVPPGRPLPVADDMQDEFDAAIARLKRVGTDVETIEATSASIALPKTVVETLSAFAPAETSLLVERFRGGIRFSRGSRSLLGGQQHVESGSLRCRQQIAVLQSRPVSLSSGLHRAVRELPAQRRRRTLIEQDAHLFRRRHCAMRVPVLPEPACPSRPGTTSRSPLRTRHPRDFRTRPTGALESRQKPTRRQHDSSAARRHRTPPNRSRNSSLVSTATIHLSMVHRTASGACCSGSERLSSL